jgi:peptidyl-prolyl cis-trans isomerase D
VLEKMRDPKRAKNIAAYIIFGFICFIFVFVGLVPDRTGITATGTAATVNDTVISTLDFQERVNMIEKQMGNAFNSLPAAQRQERTRMLRENALDELVNYELVFQSARRVGVLPTVGATRDLIVNIPAFQEEGRFTRELYERYLNYRNTSASAFEDKVQRDVVIGQLRELFVTAMQTPKDLRALDQQVQDTKLNLEFVKIDPKALEDAGLVSSSDVDAYLAKADNKKKVQSYYDSHKDEFGGKEEVHARHILIKGTTEESLKKIKDIRAQALKGDFAKLAEKYSEDEGSKTRGGDLNFFGHGQMVKEFEDAAFSLPVGQISEPIKTSFGYHIIKVDEKRGGKVKPLAEVEKDIAKKMVVDEQKDKFLKEVADTLKAKKDISSQVARLKLKWQETGEFALGQYGVPKIEAGEEALTAALSLKKVGEVYPDLVRAGPENYILRLKSLKTPESTKLESGTSYPSGGNETLGLWAEELKKSARIRKNESILN